ncbi:hypothetical protein, partial [Escherichia coli]|uniref:hypothetical protein n=1 Tax=Escherichia coli TaxID=562 RepID=UPI0039E16971
AGFANKNNSHYSLAFRVLQPPILSAMHPILIAAALALGAAAPMSQAPAAGTVQQPVKKNLSVAEVVKHYGT